VPPPLADAAPAASASLVPPVDRPARGVVAAVLSLITPPRFRAHRPAAASIFYAPRRAGRPPLADVYLPEGAGPHPSAVIAHGGGFVIGSRRMKAVRLLATRLIEAGLAVLAFDYRLVFRGGGIDEALDDVRAAVRFWRGAAARFGLDPARISLVGISAGATLALLHAGESAPGDFHRVVAVFGPTDFGRVDGVLARFLARRLFGTADRAVWTARSPIASAGGAAPLLLVHGEADVMVPIEHARRLADERARRGLPVETLFFPGEPHAFLNDALRPAAVRAVAAVAHFLGGGEGRLAR
jgi:acetyl esterase/lipase